MVSYVGADGSPDTTWSYRDGTVSGNGQRVARTVHPVRVRRRRPVAVLTSRLTASSGEAMVLAFRGRPGARSFGEPTLGVPTGNALHHLADGALLVLTETAGADQRGRAWDKPIPPDVHVRATARALADGQDPVLAAAERWLARQPSCRAR